MVVRRGSNIDALELGSRIRLPGTVSQIGTTVKMAFGTFGEKIKIFWPQTQ